jgi:hypothetical protein
LDGPSGDKLSSPTQLEHWSFLLPGAPPPNYWVPGDETVVAPATTPLIDRGQAALSFTATGLLTYQQSVTGSALPWIGVPQTGGAGARIDTSTAAAHDPGMPTFVVFDFNASSTGGDRTLFSFSPDIIIQLKSTGFAQITASGSTVVAGTVDLRSATARHRMCAYWDPGDAARGGSIVRVWTRHQTIAVTAGDGFGGAIRFPGAGTFGIGGALSPPVMKWRGLAVWNGWAARVMANIGGTRMGGRSLLVASGATVLY